MEKTAKEKTERQSPEVRQEGEEIELSEEALKELLVEEMAEPPIEPGEIFDPEVELKLVLSHRGKERRAALEEYKEKLAYQKEGLAKMQEELIRIIRQSPDTKRNELVNIIDEFKSRYGLTEYQKNITTDILDKYEIKRKEVLRFLEEIPDDRERYRALFGVEPKGEVEVIDGPMTIYFRCHNLQDYGRIYYQGRLLKEGDRKLAPEELKTAGRTHGVFITNSRLPGLEGTIIAENAKTGEFDEAAQNTYIHEEQHAMKHLMSEERINQDILRTLKTVKDREGTQKAIKNFLRERRERLIEEAAKDEILAFMKAGHLSADEIMKTVGFLRQKSQRKGAYDYFINDKEQVLEFGRREFHKVAPLSKEEIDNITENTFDEVYDINSFNTLVMNGVSAFVALWRAYKEEFDNPYFKERIIALLVHEPLYKWKTAAKRLMEAKKKREKSQ